MLLSEVLPEYHFRERHERRVDAPAEAVFAAIRSVTLAETPIARRLIRLRGLRAGSVRPLVEEMDDEGFAQFAEEPLRELVYAAIGQPWKPLGGKRADTDDFGAFAEPGYAKIAFNFRFEGGVLSTETRVLLTDARSRKLFRGYWLVIRPFSGLIRREWLRAIGRTAATRAARTDGRIP
jgi:hypothetical protein